MGATKRRYDSLAGKPADEGWHRNSVSIEQSVRKWAVDRSELLSGAAGGHGDAQLTEHVSPDDVQLWQAACLLHREPSMEELGIVLKVADALADSGLPSWIEMLAKRTLATSWATPVCAAETLGALAPLRPQTLRRVFSSCLATSTIDNLLQACPQVLHPHIVSAAVDAASGTLVAGVGTLDTLLSALPHTQFSAPSGLRSLSLPSKRTTLSPSTPALLAHAVSSHRSLTSLLLSSNVITAAGLRQFRAGLGCGALAGLSTFAVSVDAQPEGCIELSRCLAALPAVVSLHVFFSFSEQHAAAAGGGLAPFIRAAAAPAVMKKLRFLGVTEVNMKPSSRSCLNLFLPLLDAPILPNARLSSGVAVGTYDDLLMPLRHLSAIQELHIDADLWQLAPSGAPAATSGALPVLTRLRLSSVCAAVPVCAATAAMPHATGTLRSLSLEHVCRTDTRRPAAVEVKEETATWAAFFAALCTCTALQSLNLGQLTSFAVSSGEVSWSEGLTATLGSLTQLTHLRMRPPCTGCEARGCSVLEGAALGDALRRLTALQVLEVCGGAACSGLLPIKAPEHVLEALADLPQLRSLGLCFLTYKWLEVVGLVARLPALKVLKVPPALAAERDQGSGAVRAGVEVRCHACGADAKPLV